MATPNRSSQFNQRWGILGVGCCRQVVFQMEASVSKEDTFLSWSPPTGVLLLEAVVEPRIFSALLLLWQVSQAGLYSSDSLLPKLQHWSQRYLSRSCLVDITSPPDRSILPGSFPRNRPSAASIDPGWGKAGCLEATRSLLFWILFFPLVEEGISSLDIFFRCFRISVSWSLFQSATQMGREAAQIEYRNNVVLVWPEVCWTYTCFQQNN